MSLMNDETLWIVFRLGNSSYAVKSDHVYTITLFDKVTPLAGQGEDMRGIIMLRGKVTPMMDLRVKLMRVSMEQEIDEFGRMIAERRQEHLNWIDTLEESVQTGTEFKLATDPHKCTFGKWYDQFHTDNQSLHLHLRRIETPHRRLHETAHDVLECMKKGDKQKAEALVRKARRDYVGPLVMLLEQLTEVYRRSIREIAVVVEHEDSAVGLIVEEVEAVEELRLLEDAGYGDNMQRGAEYVYGVAERKNSRDLVFLLDDELLCRSTSGVFAARN